MAIVYVVCGGCKHGYDPRVESHSCSISRTYKGHAQLRPEERPVVFENPITGEVRYPPRQNSPMYQAYKDQGFQRREFTSYHEHKAWCDAHQVVNHAVEGIKDSALKDGR